MAGHGHNVSIHGIRVNIVIKCLFPDSEACQKNAYGQIVYTATELHHLSHAEARPFLRFAGRRLILNVKNLATVLLGNLQPKAISETARISYPKAFLHAQRRLCLKRVPLEPDTAETCPQSLHVACIPIAG